MKHKWPLTPLGEVLTERRETPSEEDLASGRVRIIEKISFDTGRIELRADGSTRTGMILVRPGDLVVSGINAAKGAIAIYDPEAALPVAATVHYGAYVPNLNRADVRFLWWMLHSRFFQNLLNEYVPGGIKTELKATRLLPVPVPMPSVEEQRRITARIDELAAQIQEARTLRQQAAQEAEALLTSTISAKVFSASEIMTNQLSTLEGVCELVTDGAHNTPRYVEEGVPLLTAKNVFWDRIDIDNIRHISREEHEPIYRRCPVRRGDVLFINIGATTGTARKVDIDMEFSVKNVAMLRADTRQLDTDFLVYLLRGLTVRDQIAERQAQTCQQFLALRDIRNLKVPVPPLSEQRRIVIELDALREKINVLKRLHVETATKLDALLPSILDRAFKGQL